MEHRERMEQYARRHGYESYDQMRQMLLLEQRGDARKEDPTEKGLEEAALKALLGAASSDSALERNAQLNQLASEEIRRQVQTLLERFPQLQQELGKAAENSPEAALKVIAGLRNGPEVLSCWRNMRPAGLELADAFLLKNYQELLERQSEAARQAAINSMAGRAHLLSSSGGQGEEVRVPGGVYELYRALNPGATEQEIKAHYKKSTAR